MEKIRWGGDFSEPTLPNFGLSRLNEWVRNSTNWKILTITNGSTLPTNEDDVPRYLYDILGYETLSPEQKLAVSIDRYHFQAYSNYHAQNGFTGNPRTSYQERINCIVNFGLALGVNGGLKVNTIISGDENPQEAVDSLRSEWQIPEVIPIDTLNISIYTPVQEALLTLVKMNKVSDLRDGNSFPDSNDPVTFVRKERDGLFLYLNISDFGFRRIDRGLRIPAPPE